ncbi:MAG TPA: SpoIIE family protein phosphatase [Candidatus Baltobacteraceae bacterium]|nr:SpoIIE family protein phosphatase [Candidatus Baltobacteraceae bacterium]
MAAVYVGCAELGFSVAFTTKQVTAVWPPTGIAVAALVLWGWRLWPGVFAGALISNALAAEPLWAAAAIATSNTAAPLLTSILLRRADFQRTLERARDVIALIASAGAGMVVSATFGVTMLALAGIVPWRAFGSVWPVWWAGDSMGVLVLAPVLLTFAAKGSTPAHAGRRLELLVLFVALGVVTWGTFVSDWAVRLSVYPLVIWTALRFGQRETATSILAITAICVWGTAHQLGTFGTGTEDERLLSVMAFVASLSATGLLLTAAMCERWAANSRLASAVETLQSGFLPGSLPQREGARIDGLFLPAESEAHVGGDWYDAFERPDGSVVVSIGDVAGHGLVAAVTAGKLRQAIFATAFDTDDPARVLERVNRALPAQAETLATALVAMFDPSLHRMRYATAGHPPPMVASPSQPARALEFGGLPLGIGGDVQTSTHDIVLAAKSAVLFYTDGLVEFNRHADRAEASARDALTRLVAGTSNGDSAAEIARAVMGGARPDDDVAVVVVRLDS